MSILDLGPKKRGKKSIRELRVMGRRLRKKGFTLIEALMGIAFMGMVLLGLAQLFCLSVMNNQRSGNVTNASFLAQQQIDLMRNFTADELRALVSSPIDEQIDTNSDGTIDFRRITQVKTKGYNWSVEILIFSPAQLNVDMNELIANPTPNQVRAQVATIISR